MKRIFSSPNLIAITQLKRDLENAGIACFIRNEVSAALLGEVPLNECTPELWIEDDRLLAQATQIRSDWQSPEAIVGGVWACPNCAEKLEPQFTTCWKCGTAKA